MKLLNELNIKMKSLNKNRNIGINEQELNFATYRQVYLCSGYQY